MNIDNLPYMEQIAEVFNYRVINIERKKRYLCRKNLCGEN